jgi:uroporphyrinogen III methyltransferase/synthase
VSDRSANSSDKGGAGGVVYLVGAGPGDPGLITVRGRELLEQADVVVYDYLASPRLLRYARPGAEVMYVGKKAAAHTMTQEEINALLVELGRGGRRVVRLKGGDPFVFGRGGEECEALIAEGVRFEVVPGITAAIAGPAYAGIPVTHRDFNSSFTLITGHEKEEQYQDDDARRRGAAAGSSDVDWNVISKLPCFAFYMGVKSLPRICANLIEHGQDPTTPAATIQWATRAEQRTVVGTIEDLPQRVIDAGIGSPAITIVGRVVSLRETINWFETRPLFGQTIAVTRTRQQASELTMKLEALGASVIEAPTIELVAPETWDEVDEVLHLSVGKTQPTAAPSATSLASSRQTDSPTPPWDWIVFTSANGVRFVRDRLRGVGRDVRVFGNAKIAAIGDATARAIADDLALHVDLCPESFVAEALADALVDRGQVAGKRFLLLRADIARPILRERLGAADAALVRDVAIYETKPAASLLPELLEAIDDKRLNWITFTSSSTARNFAALLGPDYRTKLAGVKIGSIGPITTTTLRELGLTPTVEASVYNIDGLIDAIRSRVGNP